MTWFQRRDFLQAAAAWTALGGAATVQAQSRSNVVQLVGDATVNGGRLLSEQTIQTGDQIATGPNSTLIFTVGNSAFHVRQNSFLAVERGATLTAVSMLRMLTGAVVSVWGRGNTRQIITPTLTAGIRGTGVYTEIFANQDGRSYFCNCYGTVDVSAGADHTISQSEYHQAYWGEVSTQRRPQPDARQSHQPHRRRTWNTWPAWSDQRTAWQISGKKGNKDGSGSAY